MLRVENICKTFFAGTINEKKALQGLSLHLKPGDFVTVIGGNGAGKSTLMNSIAGVFPIDSGKIIIDGNDIKKTPEHKRAKYIGRVFQDPMMGTAAGMMIEENLAIAARRGKTPGLKWGLDSDNQTWFSELLQELDLGLENRMNVPVGNLSGGQRQAIALIIASMTDIDLLILDEHTAALDPKSSETLMKITDKVVKEKKVTTLMVTHNLRFAVEYGSRLVMMHEGKCVMDIKGEEKKNAKVDDLLSVFNEISIESGN